MQDSESRNQNPGFIETSLMQCGRVFSRSLGDLQNVIYSKNDMNTVITTAAVVGAAILAPAVFTVAGVLAVAGAALGEPEAEPQGQPDADPCADAASV